MRDPWTLCWMMFGVVLALAVGEGSVTGGDDVTWRLGVSMGVVLGSTTGIAADALQPMSQYLFEHKISRMKGYG